MAEIDFEGQTKSGNEGEIEEEKLSEMELWLTEWKLGMYSNKFSELRCTKDDLRLLDNNDDELNKFIKLDLNITSVLHQNKMRYAIKSICGDSTPDVKVKVVTKEQDIKLKKIKNLLKDVSKLDGTIDEQLSIIDESDGVIKKDIERYFDSLIESVKTKKENVINEVNEQIGYYRKIFNEDKLLLKRFGNDIGRVNRDLNEDILLKDNNDKRNEMFDGKYGVIFGSNDHSMYTDIKKRVRLNEFNFKFNVDMDCDKKIKDLLDSVYYVNYEPNIPKKPSMNIRKILNDRIVIDIENGVSVFNVYDDEKEFTNMIEIWNENESNIIRKINVDRLNDIEVDKLNPKTKYAVKLKIYNDINGFYKYSDTKHITTLEFPNLVVKEGDHLELNCDVLHEWNDIIVHKNAVLTTCKYNKDISKGGTLMLKVRNLILKENAKIDLTGKGFPGGNGPGKGKYYRMSYLLSEYKNEFK